MREQGFTFIELMVVMILISLSIFLVTPSLSRLSKSVELQGVVKKISGILRYCRSEAVNKGEVYQVLFDSNLREVRVQLMESTEEKREGERKEGKTLKMAYTLPTGIQWKEFNAPPPEYPSEFPLIEFYPNGGSNGGSILLDSQDDKGYKIKVHFITGAVKVERAEEG